MSNQFSYHLPNGRFFSYFHPIRKYSKYTFCWECNATLSSKMPIQYNYLIAPQGNCTKVLVENNTNQLIIIENKNSEEIIFKILNIQ